jgi:hypothetical protein
VALDQYQLQRVLVLDLDVHQGNGTSELFEQEPRVVTFDMHGGGFPLSSLPSFLACLPPRCKLPLAAILSAPPGPRPLPPAARPPPPHAPVPRSTAAAAAAGDRNYPWSTRRRSTYDLPLPDATGDEAYLALLAAWLPRLMERHDPQLVFLQAGVDALQGDRRAAGALPFRAHSERHTSLTLVVWLCLVRCAAVLDGGCGACPPASGWRWQEAAKPGGRPGAAAGSDVRSVRPPPLPPPRPAASGGWH